jgi:antitoxin CcdA
MRMEINMPPAQFGAGQHPRSLGKRATNLSLSADVVDAAKALQINLSQVCDSYLREWVQREQERRWREEHAAFMAAYNATIEAEGLPLNAWRSF